MKKKYHVLLFFFISVIAGIFSYFFVHFTSDNVMLFTASRLFEAEWILKGVFPFFVPNMYGGLPFAFDLGIPNFHPFNLLFLLPYPWSYSIFVGLMTLLFLIGFYLLFQSFSKDKTYSVVLTIILFFSGSGFIRLANPTVYAVVAHMGLFLYSLLFLKGENKNGWFFAVVSGVLLTLSGQFPIVLFGYFLGILVGFLGNIPWKRLILFYTVLLSLMSWYFILSLPLNLTSTRITDSIDYSRIGNLHPLHFISFLFPYMFGEARNGSNWFMDVPYQTYLPFVSMLFAFVIIWKAKWQNKIILFFLYISAMGLIHIPLLRGAVQFYIVIHIYLILLMSLHKGELMHLFKTITEKRITISVFIISLLIFLILQTPLFSQMFLLLYSLLKKNAVGLFYDRQTIQAVGVLISHNFLVIAFVSICLFILNRNPKKIWIIFISMIICEGVFFNYLQMYFIPTRLVSENHNSPIVLDTLNYRIQSAADTIPYFGYFVYQENITLRPPFSKEKTIFSENEQKTFVYLSSLFSYIPSSWSLVKGTKSVQGYSTFVPKKACLYYRKPSVDWKTEYKYITDKNPLFGIKVENLCINSLETSRVTLNDPRWEQLAVRYFISDRPLKKYKLIYQDHRYFYENEKAPPIYGIVENGAVKVKPPYYEDPNQMKFKITQNEIGKSLQIIINPDGFVVEYNKKRVFPKTESFKLLIPLASEGEIKVYYSPIEHLKQSIKAI